MKNWISIVAVTSCTLIWQTNATTNVGATPSQLRWKAVAEYPWVEARKTNLQVCFGIPYLQIVEIKNDLTNLWKSILTSHLELLAIVTSHFLKCTILETYLTIVWAEVVYRSPIKVHRATVDFVLKRSACLSLKQHVGIVPVIIP